MVLENSAILGRMIRQDGLDTLGTSTQTLIERALLDGRYEEAKKLIPYYFHIECQIVQKLMFDWMKDLQLFISDTSKENGLNERAQEQQEQARNERYHRAMSKADQVLPLVDNKKTEEAIQLIDSVRKDLVAVHDLLTSWIQDLLTFIADTMGEEMVPEAVNTTYNKFWIPRYRMWLTMTSMERLYLSVEGMRGHFSGTDRKGDVEVIDEGDRYKLSFNPCGSGGVMRRGNPETGTLANPTYGVNQRPHVWTWGKEGVHWYCSHCNMVTEWFTLRDFGHPIRPNGHSLNPFDPCKWYIYKNIEDTPDHFYTALGGSKHA